MSDTEDVRDLFGFNAPTEEQLSSISKWASEALALRAEIEQVQAHLKHLNKELAKIEEDNLPKAMLAAGSTEFTMSNGGKISIADVIQGGFSKDPAIRQFIFDWVINQGGQEIIKDHFEIDYTRGSYDNAVAFRKLLREHKINFDEFENIHTGQLYAFLKEVMKESKGKIMPPFEDMALRYFKRANIKLANED